MPACGKMVRFSGKVSSGKALYCILEENHTGNCSDVDIPAEEAKKGQVGTVISPNGTWPFPAANPKGGYAPHMPPGATRKRKK